MKSVFKNLKKLTHKKRKSVDDDTTDKINLGQFASHVDDVKFAKSTSDLDIMQQAALMYTVAAAAHSASKSTRIGEDTVENDRPLMKRTLVDAATDRRKDSGSSRADFSHLKIDSTSSSNSSLARQCAVISPMDSMLETIRNRKVGVHDPHASSSIVGQKRQGGVERSPDEVTPVVPDWDAKKPTGFQDDENVYRNAGVGKLISNPKRKSVMAQIGNKAHDALISPPGSGFPQM
eukprot:TRINITY_DN712_c0_g1_i2.p1 TRINITY_DN712_c0_g1~~TRINITY_DN712_c0_g1_i2.p1  ORF type:complete len:234 (+),score=59.03 TRINITY_DN712_c0_g1_i2:71-772(+)